MNTYHLQDITVGSFLSNLCILFINFLTGRDIAFACRVSKHQTQPNFQLAYSQPRKLSEVSFSDKPLLS